MYKTTRSRTEEFEFLSSCSPMLDRVGGSVRSSVCLSVRLSQTGTTQGQMLISTHGLHLRVAEGL